MTMFLIMLTLFIGCSSLNKKSNDPPIPIEIVKKEVDKQIKSFGKLNVKLGNIKYKDSMYFIEVFYDELIKYKIGENRIPNKRQVVLLTLKNKKSEIDYTIYSGVFVDYVTPVDTGVSKAIKRQLIIDELM